MGPPKHRTGLDVGGILAGVAVATLLSFGSLMPHPSAAGIAVDGVHYNALSISVVLPQCGAQNGTPSKVTFGGIVFDLHVGDWCSPGGGVLSGTGTEPSGTTYSFTIVGVPGPQEWVTWISSDRHFGVEWDRGFSVQLLVAS